MKDAHPPATPLAGQLLIAMPHIGDARFEKAVILICAHTTDHAMGIAVNQPVGDLTMPDLLVRLGLAADIEMPRDLVLYGGPVEKERGFVLHTPDYASPPATLEVGRDLALTATREVLEVIGHPAIGPRRSILALGYAGWGAGQLEDELAHNAWLTCEADEDLVFGQDHETKWVKAMGKLGVDPRMLSDQAGRA